MRRATDADLPALRALIAASVRGLGAGHYTAAQIESALRHVFGVDARLVRDGTYYVVDVDGVLVACGGWSRRRTLHGGDHRSAAGDPLLDPVLDPAVDAARIRAFFVHPAWARRGLARRLFAVCRAAAHDAGFRALELMATRPGEPLYASLGFRVIERVDVALPDGLRLPCARMARPL